MFLKSLIISSENQVIREIFFRKGINLIVDESLNDEETKATGNDVGKTTMLKLIDFCLGADPHGIYIDPENKKNEYLLIKNFLKEKKVLVTLILTEDLDNPTATEIIIERNFISRKEGIRNINGVNYSNDKDFESKLQEVIFPSLRVDKPTFRQVISHNMRYEEENIIHTLKTLSRFTTDSEYETLHLFLLGCEVGKGNAKQLLLSKIYQEETFKKRLEKHQTKTTYETALALIEKDIEKLNKQKDSLNLNENFDNDLKNLSNIRYNISKKSTEISRLNIRKDLIIEAENELKANTTHIDTQQLQIIYQQAIHYISSIQKTFSDLVLYHNQMIQEKIKFITQELPTLEIEIKNQTDELSTLLIEEKRLVVLISKSDTFDDLDKLITALTEKYRLKGEYQSIIQQVQDIEETIKKSKIELNSIDDELFSDDFEQTVKAQVFKFNQYFSDISKKLYDEQYALTYTIDINKKGQKLYKFSTFNASSPNLSSGKKQGEISCFDIAYILFAGEENIPCLHFILNDKKELMHDNQLVSIAELVNRNNMQFVASILQDKLPAYLNKNEYFILKLSQTDKLFRV